MSSNDDFDDDIVDDNDDDEFFSEPKPAPPAAITRLPGVTAGPDIAIHARYNNLMMPLFVPRNGKLIDLKHQIFELTGSLYCLDFNFFFF